MLVCVVTLALVSFCAPPHTLLAIVAGARHRLVSLFASCAHASEFCVKLWGIIDVSLPVIGLGLCRGSAMPRHGATPAEARLGRRRPPLQLSRERRLRVAESRVRPSRRAEDPAANLAFGKGKHRSTLYVLDETSVTAVELPGTRGARVGRERKFDVGRVRYKST